MVVKKVIPFLALFLSLILLIGYLSFHTNKENPKCPVRIANASIIPNEISYINGFLILNSENETLLKGENSYLVRFPRAYPFKWGFVGVKGTTLQACTYSGKPLWSYEINSTPSIISASGENLFVFVPAEVPPGAEGNNTLYVFTSDGLSKEFIFPNIGYPPRCALLKSRRNYTLFALSLPQADGTAGVGRVLIFSNTEVIFNKTLLFRDSIEDPVYSVGDVSSRGIAAFGIYRGVGVFNGSFTYVEMPPYGASDIAVVGEGIFALVPNETPDFRILKKLIMIEGNVTKVVMENLSESAELFSSDNYLLLTTAEKAHVFSADGKLIKSFEYHGARIIEGEKLFICDPERCTPLRT